MNLFFDFLINIRSAVFLKGIIFLPNLGHFEQRLLVVPVESHLFVEEPSLKIIIHYR